MARYTNQPTRTLGPPQKADCECFTGTPYTKSDGSCGCHLHDEQPIDGGPKVPWTTRPQVLPTVKPPVTPVGTTAKANDDGLIFGFSPLVVLGAAAAGLFLLSSMDGKK